jgi:DNA-binding NarL/FixJ family response regulator
VKILIVDDHKMFCDGVRLILQQLEGETEVLVADRASEALRLVANDPDFDLVMLDINLPDGDGVDLLISLSQQHPTLPIVMLTASESRSLIRRCFELGASGYIPKASSADIMLNAVRLVASGGIYVPPSLALVAGGDAAAKRGTLEAVRLDQLTERQAQVLEQLRDGASNKEIAERLGVSEATVKVHISAILKTLGLRSRLEAALLAQKEHFRSG